MTKEEFLLSVPVNLEHKIWGKGKLQIVADTKGTKGACYSHKDRTTSFGSYAPTWKELYQKLRQNLHLQGYLKG